jgi:hypothetical protein
MMRYFARATTYCSAYISSLRFKPEHDEPRNAALAMWHQTTTVLLWYFVSWDGGVMIVGDRRRGVC